MQGTLEMFYKPYRNRDKRQQALDFQIVMLLVRANLPFNFVKGDAFKDFIKYLDPRATVKTPRTYCKNKLPLLYNNFKREVDAVLTCELNNVHMAGFTTDFWTSRTGSHFVNLSLHYLNDDWELRHFCVAFKKWDGRTTGIDIGTGLDELVELLRPDLKPECHTVCMTDGAANMIAGIRASTKMDEHLVCMDHQLQTVLRHTFEDKNAASPIVDAAIKRATSLATHVHKSYFAHNLIKTEAESMKGDCHCSLIVE